jgi:hypothetical protein
VDALMALKYKVMSIKYPDAEIYIEVFKIIELLSFSEYLKEIHDPWKTRCLDEESNLWAFHPERNYDLVAKKYAAYRIETGELRLIDKKHTINIGDYICYDPAMDEMLRWDTEAAKRKPNLQLVES